MKIPQTKKESTIDIIHGFTIDDPYRWLENDSEEVIAWSREQDLVTRRTLMDLSVRQSIKSRLKELYDAPQMHRPIIRGNRYFFRMRKVGEDFGPLYVQDGLNGAPRLLLDPNLFSEDKTVTLSDWNPSRDGKLLLYSTSQAGNDKDEIKLLNVETGEPLNDVIPSDSYPVIGTWSSTGDGFWYKRRHAGAPLKEEKFHQKIYWHALGDHYSNDKLFFGENIKKEDRASIGLSVDGKHALISVFILSEKKKRTELFLCDLHNSKKEFIPVLTNLGATSYGLIHRGHIYVRTDHKAPNGKLLRASLNALPKTIDSWETILQESDNALDSFAVIQDKLFVDYLKNASSEIVLYNLEGKHIRNLALPGIGTMHGTSSEREGNELFFSFSSYNIPPTVYRMDINTLMPERFSTFEPVVDFSQFEVKQEWFKSKDGTRVPMFLVHKKNLEKNGNNPALIYAYGGFAVSITPAFKTQIIPFIENGGIYAEVNIRGGGEFGEKWHEKGMRENKQNSFDDFIAAIEFLILRKYTSSEKIGIFGWSNGGLLVSSVITQRPSLVKAAVIGAPVTDMFRYQFFNGGKLWMPEYGISTDPAQFEYLKKYSPYHNVLKNMKYPAALVLTADRDDRVHPSHAFKLVAKLQECSLSGNSVFLRVELKAGHAGAAGVSNSIEQQSDILAFLFQQLGIDK